MLKWKGRALSALCTCCVEPPAATGISRRQFVAGAAAAGLAATAFAPKVFAQAKPHRIDVHAHVVPPSWLNAMEVIGRRDVPLSNWSPQKMIEDMDRGGVATSILSPTTPQVTPFGKDAAVRVSRESNEYSKKLESDHPGRFGIMTSYGDKWLGDATFAPVWEELNRRKATVYTHPTGANCCVSLVPGIRESTVEFGADTTRSIASLILSGTSQKYKDINWIWSHGGGVLTSVAERFLIQIVNTPPHKGKFTREIMQGELDRFYYDTAQISNAVTLDALAKLVPISQIVYGTDFPYRTAADHTKGVNDHFKGEDLKKVDRENALRLLPRLKSA
jgi:predicted TIM-barrel fold metal-dependent hydrolase